MFLSTSSYEALESSNTRSLGVVTRYLETRRSELFRLAIPVTTPPHHFARLFTTILPPHHLFNQSTDTQPKNAMPLTKTQETSQSIPKSDRIYYPPTKTPKRQNPKRQKPKPKIHLLNLNSPYPIHFPLPLSYPPLRTLL